MEIPQHYSLKEENDSHFVLHDARDGKTFKVAKNKVHPAHQIKILKMQKLSKGTDSVDDGDEESDAEVNNQNEQGAQAQEQQQPGQNIPPSLAADPQAQSTLAAQPATQPQAQQSLYPTSADLNKAITQGVGGIQAEASAQQKQNEAMAAQYQKNMDEQQKFQDAQMAKLNQYQAQYDDIEKQVMAGKIDPNKYMHEKSTGSKVAAAIGIMLGGIGSGLTGQPNMALQVLNKHIENDIEAQKANLGMKQSLLGHNLAKQGNLLAATNATRLQMNAMAQGQLQKIALQTGNPIIAARAQQQAAAIMQNTIPIRMQVANNEVQMRIRGDVLQRLSGQGQPGSQPVDMQDMARAGLVTPQTAEKEGGAISRRQQAEAFVTDQFNKMREESRFWGSGTIPNVINPQSANRYAMAKAGILQAIQAVSPSKKLNPEMLAIEADPFFAKMFDSEETSKTSLNGLISLIRSHAEPTPMAYHYKIPGAISGDNTVRKDFNLGPVK